MIPLTVWLTRPHAYEIYMGGDRHLELWLEKPCYMHTPNYTDGKWPDGSPRHVDAGWTSPNGSVTAKSLLKQDNELYVKVWQQVLFSCAPRGHSFEESLIFCDSTEPVDGSVAPHWRTLYKDKEWEAQCNMSHKRFLLQIDLRSNEVERILPAWMGREKEEWVTSDEIDPKRAVEYYHPQEEGSGVPF